MPGREPSNARDAGIDAVARRALDALAESLNEHAWNEDDAFEVQATARRLLLASCVVQRFGGSPSTTIAGLHASLTERLPPPLTSALLAHHDLIPEPSVAALTRAFADDAEVPDLGRLYEALLELELDAPRTAASGWNWSKSAARRRSGSHYTPPELARSCAERCLEPLVHGRSSRGILQLRVCDPAMGAGALLHAAAVYLADCLEEALRKEGRAARSRTETLGAVIRECLYGVDLDPFAVLLTQLVLGSATGFEHPPAPAQFRCGDSLATPSVDHPDGFSFPQQFPTAFDRDNPGFDAIVGNPPWVAYVGRATQPLSATERALFTRRFRAFRRYRTLHGVFTERATELLRAGGRLGFILPTSVADLSGYAPTRAAHDRRCQVDAQLPDLGDGRFAGVFQPCMVLLSTRRPEADGALPDDDARTVTSEAAGSWPLERTELGGEEAELLSSLARRERCPRELFGERGYQTNSDDRRLLFEGAGPPGPGWIPLRSGSEVGEFRREPPRWYAPAEGLSQRLRRVEQWAEVKLLIRQTARYPLAAASDGLPFRNSVLAGFESQRHPWPLLLAYLNSTLVRWFHYQAQRDARQGMPQLKIGHLRALPCPPLANEPEGRELLELGGALAEHNRGIDREGRQRLDQCVTAAFGLTPSQCALVERWGKANPPPTPRGRHRA